MLLIQFKDDTGECRVGCLDDDGQGGRLVDAVSTYELAQIAISRATTLEAEVLERLTSKRFDYHSLVDANRLLPPLDHPDSAHCLATGTGLTHLGSADTRDAMHQANAQQAEEHLTDSMKMFRMGLEGGKPEGDNVGVQPEWFYKGDGSIVRASGETLEMPDFALDGGEEPELAGLYVIGPNGTSYRVGYCLANEFSDHVTERQNYLWLAHSKLRMCGLGPALRTGALPEHVEGVSRIRDSQGAVRWEKPFVSGEANMSHSIHNLEHHHFKYELFRRPGDVHIHFFGTATLSVADNIEVAPGETFEIESALFGPPLRNTLRKVEAASHRVVAL
ncbi:AraD1 family protein [Phytohalomonas tamaricis]|uniref:AraD1 family protein n=1 Tax=Phytohalomonas tamaricis TaxID=2081032 RepID=UPI000D0B62BC|nr:AraD1 family protein [Phytohalomonas tamaricis]